MPAGQTLNALALIVVSVLLSTAGQTFLKIGLDSRRVGEASGVVPFLVGSFGAWQVWAGLVFFAGSVLVWMRVLSQSELSWGYPLLGLSYVMVALAGWLVFGEQLSATRILGIALVIGGSAFIASS